MPMWPSGKNAYSFFHKSSLGNGNSNKIKIKRLQNFYNIISNNRRIFGLLDKCRRA